MVGRLSRKAMLGLTIAVATAASLAGAGSAQAYGPCTPRVIDHAGLPAGTFLGEQLAAEGIHMSGIGSGGFPDKLIVFDSNGTGSTDPDLEQDVGNLAILPESIADTNADGLVDHPSDSMRGGTQIYRFDQPRTVKSFVIVDIDHGVPSTHFAAAFDANGDVIKEVPIIIGADGNVQTVVVNADNVRRLEISYRDSAGVTRIDLGCSDAAGQGCTPGFWKQTQHFSSWTAPYDPTDAFSSVFENAFPSKTLDEVLGLGGGSLNALGRHTVAALLNAASPDVSSSYSVSQVVAQFNATYPGTAAQYETSKDQFADANERACPLPIKSRSTSTRLGRGERGGDVRRLQRLLRTRGYRQVKVSGYFNAATRAAVRAFQERKGIKVTGVVAADTWRALRAKRG